MFKLATLIALTLLGVLEEVAALGPRPDQIENLVTFGDSYTDVVRTIVPLLGSFINTASFRSSLGTMASLGPYMQRETATSSSSHLRVPERPAPTI